MRNLMDLGSPNSLYYTVFCCSHVIIAFIIFMVLDLTLVLFSLFFELFVILNNNAPNHIWAIFHGISLISLVSGFFVLCGNPMAILIFGCRIMMILGITFARFIVSIREFSTSGEPTLQELLSLLQIIPVIIYAIGIFLVIRLFSFATGRYRGFHDVDDGLRLEIRRLFEEYEASINVSPTAG